MKDVTCKVCGKEEKVWESRAKTYVACSKACLSKFKIENNPNKVSCTECGKLHYKKPSELLKYKRQLGFFCSVSCLGAWKSKHQKGVNNPNFRNKMYDYNGSRLVHSDTYGRQKLHHAIAFEVLDIDNIPKGYAIHHRDCNHANNSASNLALLSASDHRWLHAQFGSATLWAFVNGKISSTNLVEWSNDPWRALCLLNLNLPTQKIIQDFMINKITPPTIEPEWATELSDTVRGQNGWGSSGN